MTDKTASPGPSQGALRATGEGPGLEASRDDGRRRRLSAKRKQAAVVRVLRGEDLELVSRELGVMAARLSQWRNAFLAAGEAALRARPADGRDEEIGQLRAKVGELTMVRELLEGKIDRLEAGGPLARRRSRR